ncbi:MAG: hypothetical protein ACYCZO_12080 [Daejeonella sp.]
MKQIKEPLTADQGSLEQIKPKRSLVYENLAPLPRIIDDFNKIIALANDVADQYEELNIGEFTRETYKDLVSNGILNVREKYLNSVKSEISRLKINNPTVKSAMLDGINTSLIPLKNSVSVLMKATRGTFGYFSLFEEYNNIVSFTDQRFILTEDDIELLKEVHCRIYTESKEQEDALESLQNVIDAYNNLIEKVRYMNPQTAKAFTESSLLLAEFMGLKDGKAFVYKPYLDQFLYTP